MLPVPANMRRNQVVCLPFIKETTVLIPRWPGLHSCLCRHTVHPSVHLSLPPPPITLLTLLLTFLLAAYYSGCTIFQASDLTGDDTKVLGPTSHPI